MLFTWDRGQFAEYVKADSGIPVRMPQRPRNCTKVRVADNEVDSMYYSFDTEAGNGHSRRRETVQRERHERRWLSRHAGIHGDSREHSVLRRASRREGAYC